MKKIKVSRRSFLKASAASAVTFAFASCSSTSSTAASTSTSTSTDTSSSDAPVLAETSEVTYPIEEAGAEFSYWIPMDSAASNHIATFNENEVIIQYNEDVGATGVFQHPAISSESEQLGLLVASGDLPDIMCIRGLYSGGSPAGVDDGIFLDLTDLVPQYAPDYYKIITATERNWRQATTNDGRITELNIVKQSAPEFTRIGFLQSDIDQYANGVEPVTIADYEAYFDAAVADGKAGFSPDANGKFQQFMWPYGIDTGWCLKEDGLTVQYGPYTEEYKEYLTMMVDWYQKGYIYKDFMTTRTNAEAFALLIAGEYAMQRNPVGLLYSNVFVASGLEVTIANYPRLEEGQPIHFFPVVWDDEPLPGEPQSTVITKDCKDPIAALKYLNYAYTEKGRDLLNYGIEGVAYNVNADGTKTFTDYMLANPDIPLSDIQNVCKLHLCAKHSDPDIECNPNIVIDEVSYGLRCKYSDDTTIDNSQTMPKFLMDLEASTARSKIMTDVDTYIEEMTLKFITGVTSLDEFDSYIATLKDQLEIEEAIAITQEQFDMYLNKPMPV